MPWYCSLSAEARSRLLHLVLHVLLRVPHDVVLHLCPLLSILLTVCIQWNSCYNINFLLTGAQMITCRKLVSMAHSCSCWSLLRSHSMMVLEPYQAHWSHCYPVWMIVTVFHCATPPMSQSPLLCLFLHPVDIYDMHRLAVIRCLLASVMAVRFTSASALTWAFPGWCITFLKSSASKEP